MKATEQYFQLALVKGISNVWLVDENPGVWPSIHSFI